MKIDKLYTSKGFGEYLDSLSIRQFCKLEDINNNIKQIEYDALRYRKRKIYDERIANSLKKQMFDNEDNAKLTYQNRLKDINEKKIIFIDFAIDNDVIFMPNDVQIHFGLLHTVSLETLARMTNGELKLKNVII